MNRPDLEAIRARCEASTPGPWRVTTSGAVVESISGVSEPQWADYGDGAGEWFTDRVTLVETDGGVYGPTMPDAQFIAHARTDIPSLLAYIEELTRECDDRRRRCAMLARAHGALADAGCIVPTEMDETIEHAIKALAKERDEARAEASRRLDELNMVQSQLTRALTDRDNLRAEITKAQESFDDDGPSGWMPGETAIDALIRTRDEARAEVDTLRSQIERLRGVLHIVSLDEYESTTSASEKVHAHARQARIVLNETLAEVTPSDAAHIASLENLFIKACRRAENLTIALADMKAQRDEARAGVERLQAEAAPMNEYFAAGYRDGSRDAYRRGAEAMRAACAKVCLDAPPDTHRTDCVTAMLDLPIPEDK